MAVGNLAVGCKRRGIGVAVVMAGALSAGAAACSSDIFDVEVHLDPRVYALSFGQSAGNVPTVTCDPVAPDACGTATAVGVDTSATGVPSDVQVALGCDADTGRCFAQANARVTQPINVLQDDDFITKVGRQSISFVRIADVAYTLPSNTLTFDIPAVDVFAGPAGSTRETDAGVALVGSTQPVTAGVAVTSEAHLTIADGTPARALIEDSIKNEREFVFIVVAAPRIESGSPIPAGALEIDVFPRFLIGIPR